MFAIVWIPQWATFQGESVEGPSAVLLQMQGEWAPKNRFNRIPVWFYYRKWPFYFFTRPKDFYLVFVVKCSVPVELSCQNTGLPLWPHHLVVEVNLKWFIASIWMFVLGWRTLKLFYTHPRTVAFSLTRSRSVLLSCAVTRQGNLLLKQIPVPSLFTPSVKDSSPVWLIN